MSRTSTEASSRRHVLSGPTMGTRWSAVLPDLKGREPDAVAAALAAATGTVDRQMSTWRADSDLMRLNAAPLNTWVPLPAPLMHVLGAALALGRLTDGAFDIGVGSAVAAWGFGAHAGGGASASPRHFALDLLELDEAAGRARRHASASLDLSGIAKGHGVDAMASVLDDLGLADYLVGIDGELRARGRRGDGSPFAIALERPEPERREPFGVIELVDAAVATSGDYRHTHVRNGRRVSHTIDPATGEPVRHALASVTVLAPMAMDADALATALMVAGPEKGVALARKLALDAIFITRDGGEFRIVETGGLAQSRERHGRSRPAGLSPGSAP